MPRHARAWGDMAPLHQAVRDERVRALSGFRSAVRSGDFPGGREIAEVPNEELAAFRKELDEK